VGAVAGTSRRRSLSRAVVAPEALWETLPMLTDILLVLGFIAVWLLLSPCSPWTVWKNGSCAWKPKHTKSDHDQPTP
jgi:hypothetical protein